MSKKYLLNNPANIINMMVKFDTNNVSKNTLKRKPALRENYHILLEDTRRYKTCAHLVDAKIQSYACRFGKEQIATSFALIGANTTAWSKAIQKEDENRCAVARESWSYNAYYACFLLDLSNSYIWKDQAQVKFKVCSQSKQKSIRARFLRTPQKILLRRNQFRSYCVTKSWKREAAKNCTANYKSKERLAK